METPIQLTRPTAVRAYLAEIGFSPTKSLGQNFLVDANIRNLILDASGVAEGEQVIEIGPGLGVMTEGMLERGARVTAVEIDHRLAQHLERQFPDAGDRLRILAEDATRVDWKPLMEGADVRVVSNLPYSVGSRVLYDLAAPELCPASITVMVQSDVADRLVATPGSSDWGLLGLRMSMYYSAKRVREVPGSCFMPRPRVGSAVVHLTRREEAAAPVQDQATYEALVKFAFTRKRKQISGILRQYTPSAGLETALLETAGIAAETRPAEISLEGWAKIAAQLPSQSSD